jgi:TldD protein
MASCSAPGWRSAARRRGCRARAGVAGAARTSAGADAVWREMGLLALDTARAAGAEYADVRVSRHRNQSVATRERRVTSLVDNESLGLGVRVLAGGAWGFAATGDLTREEVQRAARSAVAQARANRASLLRPVTLAPAEVHADAHWRSPIEIDPFTVPVEEKVALLLEANAAALGVGGARFASSSMAFIGDERLYLNSDGASIHQETFRCWPQMSVTAVAATAATSRAGTRPPCSRWGSATSTCCAPIWSARRPAGRRTRWRCSPRGRWSRASTTSCSCPRISS